jgi:predicted enzyme related to lactoylglutathione lyase
MSALVIFSVDVRRLGTFYERVLGLDPSVEESGDIRLRGEQEELLIHSIPERVANDIGLRVPPEPREECAVKPVFNVDSLEDSLDAVKVNGGGLTRRSFTLDGLTRHDVVDPDGNIIQLRSRNS